MMKETVPTALVSPQTVQVKVQPAPSIPYGYRNGPVTSSPLVRTHSGQEFHSDLNCNNQSCYTPLNNPDRVKLSAPNSLSNLHDDYVSYCTVCLTVS